MPAANYGTPGLQDLPDTPNSWRRRLEVPELIHYVDSYEAPFFTFTGTAVKGKEKTDDYKFYSQTKRPLPDIGYITNSSGWLGIEGSKTLSFKPTLTSGGAVDATYWTKHQTIKAVAAGRRWAAVVTDVVQETGVVTVRQITATPINPNANDLVVFTAPAYPDGENRGTVVAKDTERDWNVTQIMRIPVEVTKRMAASKLHGADSLTLQKRDAIRKYKRLAERQFVLGERYENTTANTHEQTTTEGFIPWIERMGGLYPDVPIIDHTGVLSLAAFRYDDLVNDMEELFRFRSSKVKYAFCSRQVLAHFNKILFMDKSGGTSPVGRWNLESYTNSFGIDVQRLRTGFGELRLAESNVLSGDFVAGTGYNKVMMVVDPMGIRQRVLEDEHWESLDVNGNGLSGGQELYADKGLEMNLPETHGLVIFG